MKFIAEFIGTFLLVAVVIGSGIMAENLSGGNVAIALLGNTIPTGAILFVIIKMFDSVSGAHFNPAVSLVFWLRKELGAGDFYKYILLQIGGGLMAVLLVHYIFEIELFQLSNNVRGEIPLLVSEILATFGLVSTILFVRKNDAPSVAMAVALFITAGYWFTSSTSFANPAVTISRNFTDTFTGIAPVSTLYFLGGQLIGCLIGYKIFQLFENNNQN
ncbi:MAG: aquaporin family protein [Candidatus Marinimicrobia bacterium]|nr:aquaporin family protein [Candidatus Neomarinimicrobiota bacterium]